VNKLFHLWVYLETTPLLGLAVTLFVYRLAVELNIRLRNHPLSSPVLVAIVVLSCLLLATGTPYASYFQGAQYVHFLLGPATVALAIPMHANMARIRASAGAILPAILAGSMTAAISAVVIARLIGAPPAVTLSLAPKSVTTPIAMGIAEQIGGRPSLAAIFVLLTGLTAAIIGAPIMRLLRVTDFRARGLAAGTAGHGIATARILVISETAGAFGGLAIGLNGVITAVLVPLLATFIRR
jgi:predicted murein hydrolase (TIGR00659 family)